MKHPFCMSNTTRCGVLQWVTVDGPHIIIRYAIEQIVIPGSELFTAIVNMSSRTMFITQEGPANALALNKDYSQVVIAGRNVFKVFSIEEDEFVESCNLRVGKNLNLNFSCNDVAWNTVEDHLLATAATNGAVVLWNLNRPSRSKQDHVFIDHKRTVNKVSFHTTEPTWLISGSQDGTMKCFDLRTKEATRTFYSNTESVRDVQFSPHIHHAFAAVSENGNVQLWDLRRPDRCYHQFTAHSGPVFACDWHPEVTWLATASRDKTIKVMLSVPGHDSKYSLMLAGSEFQSLGRAIVKEDEYEEVRWDGIVNIVSCRCVERKVVGESVCSDCGGKKGFCDLHVPVEIIIHVNAKIFTEELKVDMHCTYFNGEMSRCFTASVWDLTGKPSLEYTIHTIASVGHIKWRPQRKYHIASCALVVDCSINVWDVRRPYIPFAAFNEHKDVATGVAWRGDPHVFLSTSRVNILYYLSSIIMEKKWEYKGTVHQLFIDFKKAYDSVKREVLYDILIEFGIPKKLVRLIKMCLSETYSRVRIDSPNFEYVLTFQDCTLYHHVFHDASRPANNANPQGISFNSKGDMTYAARVNMNPTRGSAKLSGILRKAPLHSEQFCQATSVMHRFLCKSPKEMRWFHESAHRYILTGRTLADICDHNAAVAKDLNRHHTILLPIATKFYISSSFECPATSRANIPESHPVRQPWLQHPQPHFLQSPGEESYVSLVWSVVKTLYSSKVGDFGQQTPSGNVSREETGLGVAQTALGTSTGAEPNISVGGDGDQRSLLGGGGETPGGAMSAGEDETETDETPEQHFNGRIGLGNLSIPQGDFFFGDGEMDPLSVDFDQMNNGMVGMSLSNGLLGGSHITSMLDNQAQQDWTLPSEAFPLRHEIQDRSPPPEQFPNHGSPDLNDHESQPVTVEDQPSSLLSVTTVPRLGLWDPSHILVKMLKHHAALADVQTSVSVLLALGDRRRILTTLDEATQEHWLLGYLDILARHRLWEVSTQVIQLAWIPTVMQLNQQSTTVHTSCGRCSKLLQRTGWLCDRCHCSECAVCSVCHQVVRGLYAWCQGCSHGGHLAHMQEWWEANNKQCPTGCGHICEYS
ncbi:hypothetical protein ANN_16478 [Periplaneta americana]|uniref:GATOR2 complex protein WDR24 n=1 Tax=Periplaneta americana TaxID=6978 RepID=A0ABQ8SJ30_PERAM|nr:hypothetical protein ANN_16478 [Periplaneta americana]